MCKDKEVREFYDEVENIKNRLQEQADHFQAGQIRYCLPSWKEVSIDKDILEMVQGINIDFTETPVQRKNPQNYNFSKEQTTAIDSEIVELLQKGVIRKTDHSEDDFLSPIFVRPKKNNTWRLILNLRDLNENMIYQHFKMETLKTALELVTRNCFFCSLDLKDAYFSVPVNKASQKYLKFLWKGEVFVFTACPNGLAPCPRLFTKLLKPVMAQLHRLGFLSTIFIDDTLLFGDSEKECVQNVKESLSLLEKLGFVVHPVKSVLIPSHKIRYLGVEIDSEDMTVTLTTERKERIHKLATELLHQGYATVRTLAKFIGQVVSAFQAVKFGPLWYRCMEHDKIAALKQNNNDYDSSVEFSAEAKTEMLWWRENIMSSVNDVDTDHGDPDFIMFTDASKKGWGCSCSQGRTGGLWNQQEAQQHINILELKAALLSLQTFARDKTNIHLRLMMDNVTAIACVDKMGSISVTCNAVAKEIWSFCIMRGIWVSSAYIPGIDNVEADEESRVHNLDTEWAVKTDILTSALDILGAKPEIDLFASRINCKFPQYVSFRPDPEAVAVNAFTLSWSNKRFYAFPPFCVIASMLHKINKEKATGVVVVPDWPSQPWYPKLAKMLINNPVLVSARENLLVMPSNLQEKHRLRKSLRLIICEVSGSDIECQDFRHKLQISSFRHGERELGKFTRPISQNGKAMRAGEVYIPFRRL